MTNKQNLIVCDACENILNDGVTLLPGYISIRDDHGSMYSTDDPNNAHDSMPRDLRLDLPRNRVQYAREDSLRDHFEKDGDFCGLLCYKQAK